LFVEGREMLLPIPIGVKRVATVQGAVWKFVTCAHCQQGYAYLLKLEGVGEAHDLLFLDREGSAKRAEARAKLNLLKKRRNAVLPVPCPNCGCYQDDMARQLKEEATSSGPLIAGLVVGVLALVPLAFNIPYLWILTVVLGVAGLSLVAYGDVVASRFNPNAGDPEPRKALGRRHAVRGEQLAELFAASPGAEPSAPADRPRDPGASSHNIKPA
jgi:hypothetical protein